MPIYESIGVFSIDYPTLYKCLEIMETFLVILLSLLITVHGIEENEQYEKIALLGVLDNFDVFQEELGMPSWSSGRRGVASVDSFGAVGDGISDDTQAFVSAWSHACSTPKSVFKVPKGRRYLVNATRFRGPCKTGLRVQIDGTIVAPEKPKDWDPSLSHIWLEFFNLRGVIFEGGGVIDGSGSQWWAASCKTIKTNPCKRAPTALTIHSSTDIRVRRLTIQNSQQMHFVISRCNTVRVYNMLISSPEDSPNTDGIHISESTNVIVSDSKIGTGDDCISIVNGSSTIKMKRIECGPGHGFSIGSLGKNNSTGIVSKVVLSGAYIRNTMNGLRIKTWQGGSGYVKAVRFENVRMEDVGNPIIITQFYCDSPNPCTNLTSAVHISQIMYRNITGTTKSKEAMKFACSDNAPCKNIVLTNIDLQKEDGSAETFCNSATGSRNGIINPPADCLTSNDKDYHSTFTVETKITQTLEEESVDDRLAHPEL